MFEQTYRPIKIVIVDDGSTDDTFSVGSKLASNRPDGIVYMNTSNGGSGISREVGRQIARGEFIQYLE